MVLDTEALQARTWKSFVNEDQENMKLTIIWSDSFQKREAASENKFIREKEMQTYVWQYTNDWHPVMMIRLKNLKEKLAAQRKHLDELDQHIVELEKGAGGEQH